MISQSEIGDASRVRVSGQGLSEARTFEPAEFVIDTRDAGAVLCCVAPLGPLPRGPPVCPHQVSSTIQVTVA